jgi:hypothetical protein
LLAEVDRESYARGWRDAIAALQEKAPVMAPIDPIADKRGNGANDDSVALQRQRGRPKRLSALSRMKSLVSPA